MGSRMVKPLSNAFFQNAVTKLERMIDESSKQHKAVLLGYCEAFTRRFTYEILDTSQREQVYALKKRYRGKLAEWRESR